MADEDEQVGDLEESEGRARRSGSGSNLILTILVALNTVVMFVVAYLQLDLHSKRAGSITVQDIVEAEMKSGGGEQDGMGKINKPDGIMFAMRGFTANLSQGDGPRRFVRLNLVLKFSKDSKEEEFRARKPQIRDVIISTLNSKRPEDILRVEGKNYLKEEIKAAINSFLVDGQVIDVFYVGFQVN